MEGDTKEFLVKIINTISLVMLWMLVNVYIGIYKDYGFFDERPNWTNYLFYAFFITSFILLFRYLRRKWRF